MESAKRIEALFHAVISRFVAIPAGMGATGEITVAQIRALMMIDLRGTVNLVRLAEILGVSSAAASEVVDRLVRARMVDRQRSEKDRRVVDLTLRPRGRQVLDRLTKSRTERARKLVAAVGPGDARRVIAALEVLNSILEKVPR